MIHIPKNNNEKLKKIGRWILRNALQLIIAGSIWIIAKASKSGFELGVHKFQYSIDNQDTIKTQFRDFVKNYQAYVVADDQEKKNIWQAISNVRTELNTQEKTYTYLETRIDANADLLLSLQKTVLRHNQIISTRNNE